MKDLIPHPKSLAAVSTRYGAAHSRSHVRHGSFATLTIGSLGIVYGDIGTSPLYGHTVIPITIGLLTALFADPKSA